MYEGAALAVGRQLSGSGIFQAFNDRRLSRSIVSDDEGQWGIELDSFSYGWAKGADSRNGELVYPRHLAAGYLTQLTGHMRIGE